MLEASLQSTLANNDTTLPVDLPEPYLIPWELSEARPRTQRVSGLEVIGECRALSDLPHCLQKVSKKFDEMKVKSL